MSDITTNANPGAAPVDTDLVNRAAWSVLDAEPLGHLLMAVEEGIQGGDLAGALPRSAPAWKHTPEWRDEFVAELLERAGAESLDDLGADGLRYAALAAAEMLERHAAHVREVAAELREGFQAPSTGSRPADEPARRRE